LHLVAPSTFDNRTRKGASTTDSCEMGVLADVPAGVADLRIEQNRACVQPPFSQHCAADPAFAQKLLPVRRTNQFVEQLLVNQQVVNVLERGGHHAAEVDPVPASSVRPCRYRPLRYTSRSTAGQLARKRKLPGLCPALQIEESSTLLYSDSLSYGNLSSSRRWWAVNTAPAAAGFHGAPWYDWVQYRTSD